MTIAQINTHNKKKLSEYLIKHLDKKRYVMGKYSKCLDFTYEEERLALMKALKMEHCKDAKLFLAQLKIANMKG